MGGKILLGINFFGCVCRHLSTEAREAAIAQQKATAEKESAKRLRKIAAANKPAQKSANKFSQQEEDEAHTTDVDSDVSYADEGDDEGDEGDAKQVQADDGERTEEGEELEADLN